MSDRIRETALVYARNAIEVNALYDEILDLVMDEREACAKVAELPPITDTILCGDTCDYIATAIRSRRP